MHRRFPPQRLGERECLSLRGLTADKYPKDLSVERARLLEIVKSKLNDFPTMASLSADHREMTRNQPLVRRELFELPDNLITFFKYLMRTFYLHSHSEV